MSPRSLLRIQIFAGFINTVVLTGCWGDNFQDHPVEPPLIPQYTLSGNVMNQNGYGRAGLNFTLTMQEVYHGEFVEEPYYTESTVGGFYSISDLYRGRYNLTINKLSVNYFNKDIGMINYADRELDITIDY